MNFAVGTDKIHELPEIVAALAEQRKIESTGHDNLKDVDGIDAHTRKHSFSDFISIMRGCNRFCSYCIVPYARGRERSRSPEGILEERAVWRIPASRRSCCWDRMSPPMESTDSPSRMMFRPFADLLEANAKIDGIRRIRFTSPHPAFFNTRLIEAIAHTPKVCKSIHLPLQSGSDRILKAMNRPYTAEQYWNIVDRLRTLCPESCFQRISLSASPVKPTRISKPPAA